MHDADDHKIFPKNNNNENTRAILDKLFTTDPARDQIKDNIIRMINLVSFSSNGNNESQEIDELELIPRYCDRLESIGKIGIYRAYIYSVGQKRPIYVNTTPRVFKTEDIDKVATEDRIKQYLVNKKSESMIDHFYDKILHVKCDISSPYLQSQFETRREVVKKFIVDFWNDPNCGKQQFKLDPKYY